MAIGDDFEVQADKDIRYTGSTANYTVLELHRWLQDLADDATAAGNDLVDITKDTSSDKAFDTIITLINGYNIDAVAAQHLYGGSIIQGSGGTEEIWDGLEVLAPAGMRLELIQNGALLTNFWTTGLNADAANGINHRFMVKVRNAGADIDGRRLIGLTREFGKTFGEFKINGSKRGVNTLAFTGWGDDLNNTTASATVDGWDTVVCNKTASVTTVNGVNALGQATLNVANGAALVKGDFFTIGSTTYEYQITNIVANAWTVSPNLEASTSGGEAINKIGYGYVGIDVNQDATNEFYYSKWDKGSQSIPNLYERMKWLSRRGTTERLYGLSGILFRGITHEVALTTPRTGTFAACEAVSWSGGTGQMLAIDSLATGTKMWIQLLTGVASTNGQTITGGVSAATATASGTATERPVSSTAPFCGISTGTSIIGAYGFGVEAADLGVNDKVFDLTNTQISPPNLVTFTVSGVVAAEDSILVSPASGGALQVAQFTLNGALTGAAVTSVVVNEAIPADTPASAGTTGSIRILRASGKYTQHRYSAYNAGTKTFTIPSHDFSTDNAANGANAFLGYVDKVAGSAAELWQRSIEGALTAEQMMRIMLAALAGRSTGVGSSIERYKSQDGAVDRISATLDGNFNRTSVGVNGS